MPDIELDWIRKWAHYTPMRMAFREHERDLQWTYAEFNQRVEALAFFLKNEFHIKKGQRIAVYSKNRAEYVFLFFASMKIGAILTPLNFRLTPKELKVLIHDADPSLIIFEEEYSKNIHRLFIDSAEYSKCPMEQITPYLTKKIHFQTSLFDESVSFEDPVMILYTSGTTGIPKGAIITHKMLFWNSVNTALRLDLTSADHTQSFAPFFHTGGWNVLLTPFVHRGASHTLLGSFDPDLILDLMEKEKTTIFFGVPTMMQMIAESAHFNEANLATIRYAIVGGAPMPIPLINQWNNKGIPVRQGYGLTEVGPNTFSLHQDDALRKKGSIGFPNFYIDARIVDETGRDMATGEPGELWLKSPVVTPGYWNNDSETKKAISDGWFHTGDMLIRDDEGYFYVIDRKKNMFISGGENVYPAEIEAVLNNHPDVKESAVIGIADKKWGETGLAFIVIHGNRKMDSREIKSYCKEHLAKYKIPAQFKFIEILPRNESGKIDRKKLELIKNV